MSSLGLLGRITSGLIESVMTPQLEINLEEAPDVVDVSVRTSDTGI